MRNKAKLGFMFFNNRWAGFAPQSANAFRKMLGLPEVVWSDLLKKGQGQMSLSDFV